MAVQKPIKVTTSMGSALKPEPAAGAQPENKTEAQKEALQVAQMLQQWHAGRTVFNNQYQALAELVDSINAEFNSTSRLEGEFKSDDVYDSHAAMDAQVCGSALMGLMWPDGAKSVRVAFKNDEAARDQESKDWLERQNRKFIAALDDPRCNLNNAIGEFGNDWPIYGTTTITRVPGGSNPGDPVFMFDCWNVRNFHINEGKNRQPDSLSVEFEMTVEAMVKEFGYINCAKEVRDQFDQAQLTSKVKYCHLIQPRNNRDPEKKGPLNSAIKSCHYDMTNKHKLRETGFIRRAFYTPRFYRKPGMLYAYSPAMNALPDIYLANALKEAIIIATEKQLDPPLAMLDDSVMGNAQLDTSAGGLSVVSMPQGTTQQPIFPLYTVGDMKSALALLEELRENIKNHFFLDRLLDLNNAVQMTAREAMIRDAIRNTTLRTPINRMITELFTPLVEDSWMDMYDRGFFGLSRTSNLFLNMQAVGQEPEDTIPEVVEKLMAEGKQVFEVQYLTPAMRDNQAQTAQAIIDHVGLTLQLASADPGVRNTVNLTKALDRLAAIRGVPADLLTSEDDRATMKEAQDQAQEQQAALANANQWAGVASQLGNIGGRNGQPV